MKTVVVLLVIIFAVLACGCTSTAPPVPAAPAAATPDLKGTWTGTMLGYEEGTGFTDYNRAPMSMVVTEQQGRLFAGHLLVTFNSTKLTIPIAGVIGRDGRTFALVENVNGYTTGEIVGSDTIELTHVDDARPYSVALDTLKRA